MSIYRVYSSHHRFEKYFDSEELATTYALDCILLDLSNMIDDGAIEHAQHIIDLIKSSKYSEAIQDHLNYEPKYTFEYDEYPIATYKDNIQNNMKTLENAIKEMVFK